MHHVTPHKVDGPVPVASWWALASCLEAITEIIPSTLILNGCYEHLHSHHSHLSLMLINYIKLLSSGLLNCITYGRLVWVLVFNWWLCANVFKKQLPSIQNPNYLYWIKLAEHWRYGKTKGAGYDVCLNFVCASPVAGRLQTCTNQIWLGCLQLQYTGSILRKT